MRIFYSQSANKITPPKIIALWGTGLIGQAIGEALICYDNFLIADYHFQWQNETQQIQSFLMIRHAIEELLAQFTHYHSRLIFVWSAGKAGFSATSLETNHEMSNFRLVLNFAKKFQQLLGNSIEFHLISSAGGLFEGCRYIEENNVPQPHRLYGQLKLHQEQLLLLEMTGIHVSIYRLASIYGVPCYGRRTSLIPVLIHHGILRQVVTIVGTSATLRDYVHVNDIGRYVADKIICSVQKSNIYWMISGKPSSISEVSHIVEENIRHRLYLSYKFDPDNCSDITFAPHLKPADFFPLPLHVGISQVARQWQSFI